jgi:solute carrier family 25 carnitine/acylcarnitine transporter 20/29
VVHVRFLILADNGSVRDTVGTGIFWGSYEGVKQLLSVTRGRHPDSPLAGGIAGGLCGMLAYLCVR